MKNSHTRQYGAFSLAAAVLCSFGCQSTTYRAASLPLELRVPPTVGTNQIHLPTLAAASRGSTAISRGDLLDVTVVSGVEETPPKPQPLQVSALGQIEPPIIGRVAVAGLSPSEASQAITAAAIERGVYRQPTVTVETRLQATHQITVLGAVVNPGTHALPVGACNVLSAIAAAGGLTERAGSEVDIMRQTTTTSFADRSNLASTVQTVGYSQSVKLAPTVQRIDIAMSPGTAPEANNLGDQDVVVVLAEDDRVIYVSGLVNKPDQFEMPTGQDVRVLDALAMAGGRSSPIADKVYVVRQRGETQEPAVIQVSVSKAKKNGKENLILSPGDLVSVESTVATTAMGVVESFFRVSLGLTSTAFAF